ncbi:hypothetical protein [Butyricimonas paravirosa]|uniref:hypothetical protein n=1 Tax=Butyricimonas paravirosa TaxID=1472417 RepID=UPI002A7EF33F|nr:hypothetical protein [Butyricimonas paravirosa]
MNIARTISSVLAMLVPCNYWVLVLAHPQLYSRAIMDERCDFLTSIDDNQSNFSR